VGNQQELSEAKRLETVFIFHRWLYIPGVLLVAWLYDLLNLPAIVFIAVGLCLFNILAYGANRMVKTFTWQSLLGYVFLAVDAVAAWCLIIACVQNHHEVAYIVYALVIVEAAVRFGLKGSLVMDIIFALGAYGIWMYSVSAWNAGFILADYILIVGIMSFVSLMVGMVAREWRKRRRYAEALVAERTLNLERRRIANELHDSVLKSLQGLALEAYAFGRDKDSGNTNSVAERAEYIQQICQQLSCEIRGVILELRDDGSGEDIAAQIKKLADIWSSQAGIEVEFKSSGDIPLLPLRLAHDLQKITEEALANVKRHSGATQVNLSLGYEEGLLILDIKDNGHGFTEDAGEIYSFVRQGKLGLVSMKERVELAGGRFNITSGPDGTLLSASVPLRQDQSGNRASV
jgi:signal transduction histidine kinase